jgi:hypothetical protein
MPTLHVALDESGDLHFTPKGSTYYVFTAAWTYDPAPLASDLTNLRFGLIKAGHDLDSFHACEDQQANRDLVVTTLLEHRAWNFASIVVEKRKVNPTIRADYDFYPRFASMVLKFIFRGRVLRGTTGAIIYTDTLPMSNRRRAVEATIKASCRAALVVPFGIFHHRRQSNAWIQVADYCSWGVFRKWEGNDPRTYDQLRSRLATRELDIMSKGDGTAYY